MLNVLSLSTNSQFNNLCKSAMNYVNESNIPTSHYCTCICHMLPQTICVYNYQGITMGGQDGRIV